MSVRSSPDLGHSAVRWLALGLFGALGCVKMPDPPPAAEDLSALAASYDRPTATIPESQVRRILLAASDALGIAELVSGLVFVRAAVNDTSVGLDDKAASENVDVQGVVSATLPCPGDAAVPTFDAELNGSFAGVFGVEHSMLRRGFEGALERCAFRVQPVGLGAQTLRLSATVVGDLGADLGLGSTFTAPLLIRLSAIRAEGAGGLGGFDVGAESHHFRILVNGTAETLLDGAMFGLAGAGSFVVVVRADGSVGLRDEQGEWSCDGEILGCQLIE